MVKFRENPGLGYYNQSSRISQIILGLLNHNEFAGESEKQASQPLSPYSTLPLTILT